jgi:hypothetical protein
VVARSANTYIAIYAQCTNAGNLPRPCINLSVHPVCQHAGE